MKNGLYGAVFSVSDGVSTHFFNRTLGDLTPVEAMNLAEDKDLTKRALANVGIRTPKGVVVKAGDVKRARAFMAGSGGSRFVVKPLRGSLSKHAHIEISADAAQDIISKAQAGEWLIEEFISGSEFRAYVVGDSCVGVSLKLSPTVTGNGIDTLSTLVEQRDARRAQNAMLSVMASNSYRDGPLNLEDLGLDPAVIPPDGNVVKLSDSKMVYQGADRINVLDQTNASFRNVAVASCKALGLPNAGLDIIISDDVARPGAFVLEANQRAHIQNHGFPTIGQSDNNAVSEAIIDYYFPASSGNRRFSLASFSFERITRTFQTSHVAEIVLPVLKADWHHVRLHFPDPAIAEKVWRTLLSVGCFGCLLNLPSGRQVADVLLSAESQLALLPHRDELVRLFSPAVILFATDENLQ